MQDWCSSIASMTSDLGTGRCIMSLEVKGWKDMMPSCWCDSQDMEPDNNGIEVGEHERADRPAAIEGPAGEPPAPAGPSPYLGMPIPGMLHIINNLTLDMDKALSQWEAWLPGLRCIVKLLANKDNRRRYVATCIERHARAPVFEPQFRVGPPL